MILGGVYSGAYTTVLLPRGSTCCKLRAFISAKHERGKQVFRRTVGEWIKQEFYVEMSNRAVGGLLYRLRYRRRRGRIKIPPLNEERKARVRRFLVEIGGELSEEEAETAVIVYTDESFCPPVARFCLLVLFHG